MAEDTSKKIAGAPQRTRGARSGPNEGNKSAFILSFGVDTPAAEIVKAGAARGLGFTAGYVATIRSLDRKRQAKAAGTQPQKGRPGRKPQRNEAPVDAEPSSSARKRGALDDASLIQLILQYGVVRVEEALARVKAFR